MDLQLTGKRALVTGGSRSIGRAIAETLAAEGCTLALCARGAETLDKVAAGLREQGATVHAEPVDVTDPAALAAFVERSAQELGGLDIVVSNVSAGGAKTPRQRQPSPARAPSPPARPITPPLPHPVKTGGARASHRAPHTADAGPHTPP